MAEALDRERLTKAYQTALAMVLAGRNDEGFWRGESAGSAFATAVAVSALAAMQKADGETSGSFAPLIERGLAWLMDHRNADGGWGDTVQGPSDISTSLLCRAAFGLAGATGPRRADAYLQDKCGATAAKQAEAVRLHFGRDQTLAASILATCTRRGDELGGCSGTSFRIGMSAPIVATVSAIAHSKFCVAGIHSNRADDISAPTTRQSFDATPARDRA